MQTPQLWRWTYFVVMACWDVLALGFLWRHARRHRQPSQRPGSVIWLLGLILQGVGMALVFVLRRKRFTPIAPSPAVLAIALPLFAAALAVASLWLVAAAVMHLGKQWALAARLVSEHELITTGPYGLVRHPIYSGIPGS